MEPSAEGSANRRRSARDPSTLGTLLHRLLMSIRPRRIVPGATFGVVSPGRWLDDASIARACDELQRRGFRTKVHPQNYLRLHQFAGSDRERLDAFHDVFADPEIDAIICGKGGYGALRFVDDINFDLVA